MYCRHGRGMIWRRELAYGSFDEGPAVPKLLFKLEVQTMWLSFQGNKQRGGDGQRAYHPDSAVEGTGERRVMKGSE